MKVQYASDLHLEFPENRRFITKNPIKAVGEVLLLAGDIVLFKEMVKCGDFFSYLSDHFEETYWVPGNHEYYFYDLASKCGVMHEYIKPNVHLVNNTVIKKEDVNFIFSSLWSKIGERNGWQISQRMNDFRAIQFIDNYLTTEIYNEQHEKSLVFLLKALDRLVEEKTVVTTHHVPTFLNYPKKYRGDVLNEAFAVELFDVIEKYQPNFWLYGHTHSNTPDFNIRNAQLLTNQLGYVRAEEHFSFRKEAIFEV